MFENPDSLDSRNFLSYTVPTASPPQIHMKGLIKIPNFNSHKEIHFSYRQMERTMDEVFSRKSEIESFFSAEGDFVFVACGSSYWMSLSAADVLRKHTGKNTFAVKAGDVVLSPAEYKGRYRNPVFIAPSRSGMSRELIDALKWLMAEYPASKLFSITEYEENEIKNISDYNISLPFVNEISVCQTRSFSSLYTAFLAISSILSKGELEKEMRTYFAAAPKTYKEGEVKVKQLIDSMGHIDHLVTLGAGLQYGIVIEGAYIVIEMAQMPCNYYQTLEYRHGPIVTARENTLTLLCSAGKEALPHEIKMAKEARAAGSTVVMVWGDGDGWDGPLFSLEKEYSPEVVALYFIFIAQSAAYHIALKRKLDPDKPGALTPFIVY